jgi:hypothetical protein
VSWAHNTGLGNSETENEVISPQGNIVVSAARCAGFLGVDWAAIDVEANNGKTKFLILWFYFYFYFVCVCVCVCVYRDACAYGDHKRAADPHGAEVIGSCEPFNPLSLGAGN